MFFIQHISEFIKFCAEMSFAPFLFFALFLNIAAADFGNNETPKIRNDLAAEKFTECCKDKKIDCPEVCTYPPPDFSLSEQWCMLKCNSDFIACYTGGKNNTECCNSHGVVGVYGICRNFCDGTTDHSWNPGYVVCGAVKEIISKCNHDSVSPPPIDW